MDVLKLLEYLEEIIDTSSKVPVTGKILVNKKEVSKVIDEIVSSLPEQLKKAQWIIDEKDRILSEALKETEKMRQKNQNEILKEIQTHDITKEASREADKIIIEANKKAREIMLGSREYASDVLAGLDSEVDRRSQIMLSNIQNEMEKFLEGYKAKVQTSKDTIKENAKELKKI
ncbi:MAG: ATPase [Clostridium sp.]|nr:ATPase [Clostridium sp.]